MTPPATAAARRASARAASPRRAASARRAAPRSARATARTAPRVRPAPGPFPARIVPLAVGGTAAAVSGLADTGLFVRLTRGRLWIGLLAVLLAGIVAINVFALSFGATASRLGQEADGLQRANSALRARLAGTLSDQRVQGAAMRAGLIVPEPGAINYLRWRATDARIAARRLAAGDIANAAPAQTPTATSTEATTAAPTAATTTAAAAPAPTATQPVAIAPTATTTTPTTAGTTTATTGTSATTTTSTAAATATGGVAAP